MIMTDPADAEGWLDSRQLVSQAAADEPFGK